MANPDLHPCPFCHNADKLRLESWTEGQSYAGRAHVHCGNCGADGPLVKSADEQQAAELWNSRRTEPEAEPEILREGDCAKCGKHWIVSSNADAAVSVLAVHCICGHVNK